MSYLAVDTATLDATISTLRAAADEAERADAAGDLRAPIAALVDPALAGALTGFAHRWRYGLGLLAGDTRRLADTVRLIRTAYDGAEQGVPAWLRSGGAW